MLYFIFVGDYALVEFFVKKYPATKRLTNKDGMTALQLAQKLKFNRIAQLIETGEATLESEEPQEPKLDEATLIGAVHYGRIEIIRKFIAQHYKSREEKRKLCEKLIKEAKKASAQEILNELERHYKELRTEVASNGKTGRQTGGNVYLSEHYKKILLGFLGSLNNLIAGSSVVLDPADPNTYTQFFGGLIENTAKRSEELQQVKTEKDISKLNEKDQQHSKERLEQIQQQLEELLEKMNEAEALILDTDKRLFEQQHLTALERKENIKGRKEFENQLAAYQSTMELFEREQEAVRNRQKAIEFFKSNNNLIMFYRVIESRLQSLFTSSLAAQGGYVMKTTGNTGPKNLPICK